MQIRMKIHVTGTRNGEEWPARGGLLEVSEQEGADLVAAGIAEEVRHAASGDADGGAPPATDSDTGDGLDELGVRELRNRVTARLEAGELVIPGSVNVGKLKKDDLLELLRTATVLPEPGDADGGAPPATDSDQEAE